MRFEYVIKRQIFYREMTQGNNVVKFNEAKWNLTDEIQFKRV